MLIRWPAQRKAHAAILALPRLLLSLSFSLSCATDLSHRLSCKANSEKADEVLLAAPDGADTVIEVCLEMRHQDNVFRNR